METVLKTALTKNAFDSTVKTGKGVIEFSGTAEYHHVEVVEQ